MSRFRYSGSNWEGRQWVVSLAIRTLGDQISAAFPTRHGTDGTVASKAHDANNPNSDHRPRPFNGAGIVRALDFGSVNPAVEVFPIVEALRLSKDRRIKYVIHGRRIFSSYDHSAGKAWTWRPYSGYNAHLNHGHVSVVDAADSDGSTWDIGMKGGFLMGLQIIDVQKALNEAGQLDFEGKKLAEDDRYGPRTHSALVKAFQGGSGGVSLSQVRAEIRAEINKARITAG